MKPPDSQRMLFYHPFHADRYVLQKKNRLSKVQVLFKKKPARAGYAYRIGLGLESFGKHNVVNHMDHAIALVYIFYCQLTHSTLLILKYDLVPFHHDP